MTIIIITIITGKVYVKRYRVEEGRKAPEEGKEQQEEEGAGRGAICKGKTVVLEKGSKLFKGKKKGGKEGEEKEGEGKEGGEQKEKKEEGEVEDHPVGSPPGEGDHHHHHHLPHPHHHRHHHEEQTTTPLPPNFNKWGLLMGDGCPRPPTFPSNTLDSAEFVLKRFNRGFDLYI